MHSDHASSGSGEREAARLRQSDAVWLRRGQSLGELLLTSRNYAAVGWAAGLALAGSSLIVLALLGAPETNMDATIHTVSAGPP